MLLPDFFSIIHTHFHRPTFTFKTTNPNNIFLLPSPLFGYSKELTTITTRINLLHRLLSFLIHSHIYYSLSIFFCLAIFLPIFLIPTLFPPGSQFLSEFYFPSQIYFPLLVLFERHIHQQKTMLTHKLFTWVYFHILDTTTILVIHKNLINHCFIFLTI